MEDSGEFGADSDSRFGARFGGGSIRDSGGFGGIRGTLTDIDMLGNTGETGHVPYNAAGLLVRKIDRLGRKRGRCFFNAPAIAE